MIASAKMVGIAPSWQRHPGVRKAGQVQHRLTVDRARLLLPKPSRVICSAETTYQRDRTAAPRLIQHKNEAFWFYAFLSNFYDYIVNPGNP